MIAVGLVGVCILAACEDSAAATTDAVSHEERLKADEAARALYEADGRNAAVLASRGGEMIHAIRGGYSCVGCHAFPDGGGNVGPSLVGIGGRIAQRMGGELEARVWFHGKILEPDLYPGATGSGYGRGIMPRGKANFQAEEVEAIVEYLMTLRE